MLATQQRDGILAVRAVTGHKRELIGKMRRSHLTLDDQLFGLRSFGPR